MNKSLFILALSLLGFSAGAQIVVSGSLNINGTTTWTRDNIYILQGFVRVTDQDTLVIEPGTVIKGDFATKGSLIVERGGYLNAQGTETRPIVFTSQRPTGQRSYGDWGGVIICGRASVNQPANAGAGTQQGEAVVEGGVGSIYGGGTNPNDNDDSGILRYVRIEFSGIPFQPNSEINGLTLCGVGRGTTIDHIMVSYNGDDAFEWFGGTVNVKNIISYRNWDDDFDTDFGYRGNVQFALGIRDPQIADQSGSNGFESDNDAGGSVNPPITGARFSNVTMVGPLAFNSNINSLYRRALHLRRNTQTSTFNSTFIGYPTGLLIENSSTHQNAMNNLLRFKNTILAQMGDTLATTTDPNPNNVTGSFNIASWFYNPANGNGTVNHVSNLSFVNPTLSNPNFRPAAGSVLLSGASFADSYLQDPFFTPVNFRGAIGTEDWTACWAEWDPQNEPYNGPINNAFVASVQAQSSTSICQGQSVVLTAASSGNASNVTYLWSNGQTGNSITVSQPGNYSVVATSSKRCTTTSNSVAVVVNPLPAVSITANGSTSFCTGGSVVLTSTHNSNNVWNTSAATQSITVNQSGAFHVTYTDSNGCSNTSNTITVNVSDSPSPTLNASAPTVICSGNSVTLTSSAADSYLWRLNGMVIPNATSQSIEANEEGLYTVTTTNANPCDGVGESAPIFVDVTPTPTANASFIQNFGSAIIQFLNSSTNAVNYFWNFGDGTFSEEVNPSHTFVDGGDYVVTLTAINGECSSTITIDLNSVRVEELAPISAFSLYPNPTNGMITLTFESAFNGNAMAEIFDLTGRKVFTTVLSVYPGSQMHLVDLSSLNNGLYLVHLHDGSGIASVVKLQIRK